MPDLRQLPVEVLERLAAAQKERGLGEGDDPIPGVDAVINYKGRTFRLEERRSPVEVRQAADGSPIIEGYACATGVWYDVYGGPPWGWEEMVERGAFKRSLERKDDVRLLINHDGLAIARTKSGTLTQTEDKIGLHIVTPSGIDMANPKVQELVSGMQRGDTDEMSFSFKIDVDAEGKRLERWNKDFTKRWISGIWQYDSAIVTYPANLATHVIVKTEDIEAETGGMPLELALALAASL